MLNQQFVSTHKTIALLLGALFLLFSGCAPPTGTYGPSASQQGLNGEQTSRGGQLSLFLNLKEAEGPGLKMIIHSIEVQTENNSWTPLILGPIEADAKTIRGGQIFLCRSFLATGYYSRLRLKTSLNGNTSAASAEPGTTELEIRNPLYVAKGDSHSLFLTWDVLGSFGTNSAGGGNITVAPKLKNMLVDVAYVACPEINTVYMICTDKNWVCNSLGVSGAPSYLFSDRINPTGNLFALTDNDKNIKRIGPAANTVEASYHLSSVGKPLHMAISPDSQWGYVVDKKRGNILRINLRSGSIETRNRLGYGPSYVLYLEKQGLLAVTLSLSQSVVLLNPETLSQVGAISTGNKPEGLMLYNDNYLYIAESGGNSVMIYDLTRNAMQKRIPVDLSPMRILEADGLIYVTNRTSRTISILKHGQLAVTKKIKLDGPPLELAYSSTNKWLYVGNEATKTLNVIDPVSNRMVSQIPINALPQGMAVLR